MRWFIPILLLISLVSCKNERGEYPDNIFGDWIAVESNKSWVRFDSIQAIINIHYNDILVHDTCEYFYLKANGYGAIPIEDESSELSVIEIHMFQDSPNMLIIGENKNIEGLFTYTMVQGIVPR